MSYSQLISVCQVCWKMTDHKTSPTLTTIDKVKKDKTDKQICQVCSQSWSPVQLLKNNGKWIYIRPRPANIPGEFKMCDKKGKCMKGASCTFAHSREELESWNRDREGPPMPDKPRPAPVISGNRYMMCTHHINGKRCLYGLDCKFAHSQEELDAWNSTIGDHTTTSSDSDTRHVTSPVHNTRIIPGLPVTTKSSSNNNRTRLSSLSSNTSNNSEPGGGRNLPVSLTLNHNNDSKEVPAIEYRCDTCDCSCTSMKQLLEHKAGAKHKQISRCNSIQDQPNIRARPSLNSRGLQQHSICKSVEDSGRCVFGNGCPEAHSYEELEAWNSELNNSIQALIPATDDLVPFLEKIRRELDSTDLTIHDLLQPKHGITIEEVTGTKQDIKHMTETDIRWTFRVSVKEKCELLGMIMLGEQYPQFIFTSLTISTATLNPTTTPFAIHVKHMLYPGDNFTTQVEFKHQTGCFPQVAVFKFNGFFMGALIKVTCMSRESFELQNQHQHLTMSQSGGSIASNWETVIQVIPLDLSDLKERDQCPEEYPLVAESVRPPIATNLTMVNYRQQLHTLLFIEELERRKVLSSSHLPNMSCEVSPGYRDEYMYHCAPQGFAYVTFELDDMATGSLQLIGRNRICDVKAASSSIAYQGILELFGRETLVVRVKEECAKLCEKDKASVRFTQKRKLFKYMHYAVDHVDLNLMFPNYSPDMNYKSEELNQLLNKTNLNHAQRGVIEDIVNPSTSHIPSLVCGPFGTGKTSTLVEAVSILLQVKTLSRILVCTHSNSAADIYIERLDKKFGPEFLRGKVLRHFYHERKSTHIKAPLLKYTYTVHNHLGGKFELPPLPQLKELSVIVTTIEQSGDLAFLPGLEPGHFTHIFIDEAAQVMECQALIALQLAVRRGISTKIVLAGDHMQMEEELVSKQAISHGLNRSVLERLMSTPLYATAEGRPCCTTLVHNYRTHPAILKLPSELFYENSLIAMATPGALNGVLPSEPLSFYGIQGQESKDKLSFSYENFVEAREVEKRVIALGELGLEQSEICVLSPYTKQCQIIRFLLRKVGFKNVIVDTTHGVQGREYRALIVSTVRTCRSESPEDVDHESSFINNPKLFNMAITRAKDWLVVVGDPYTMCTVGPNRSCWEKLIRCCIEYNSFHFPNIPEFLNSLSTPLTSTFPALSDVIPRTDEPLSDYSETRRKMFFRQKLLPIVEQMCPSYSVKVTNVLVEMNTQKLIELFASDNSELQKKVHETLEFLGLEECCPPIGGHVPRYLSRQLELLNEHEHLIQSYIHRLQLSNNHNALRILEEQMFLIRDQRMKVNTQYQLLQRFAALVTPRPIMNGSVIRTNGITGNAPNFLTPPFLFNNSAAATAPIGVPTTPIGVPTTPIGVPTTPLCIESTSSPVLPNNHSPILSIQETPLPAVGIVPAFNSFIPSNTLNPLAASSFTPTAPAFVPMSSGPPPGWPVYSTPPPDSFGGSSPGAFTAMDNGGVVRPLNVAQEESSVTDSVIGAPLYNNNDTQEDGSAAAAVPVNNRHLGAIGEKHF